MKRLILTICFFAFISRGKELLEIGREVILSATQSRSLFIISNENKILKKNDYFHLVHKNKIVAKGLVIEVKDDLPGAKIVKSLRPKLLEELIQKNTTLVIFKGNPKSFLSLQKENGEFESSEDLYEEVAGEEEPDADLEEYEEVSEEYEDDETEEDIEAAEVEIEEPLEQEQDPLLVEKDLENLKLGKSLKFFPKGRKQDINRKNLIHTQISTIRLIDSQGVSATKGNFELSYSYQYHPNRWVEGSFGYGVFNDFPSNGLETQLIDFTLRGLVTYQLPAYFFFAPFLGVQIPRVNSPDAGVQPSGTTISAETLAEEERLIDKLSQIKLLSGVRAYRRFVPGWFWVAQIQLGFPHFFEDEGDSVRLSGGMVLEF